MTLRVWKVDFAVNSLRSDIESVSLSIQELEVLNHRIVERLKFTDSVKAHRMQ